MGFHSRCNTLLDSVDIPSSVLDDWLLAQLATARGFPAHASETWTPALNPHPTDHESLRPWFEVLAPTLLLEGVWLARVSLPATAHWPAASHLLKSYSDLLALDAPQAAPAAAFRAGLIELGLDDALSAWLSRPPSADDDVIWQMPAIQLILLHRPRRFFPELLGLTAAHCELDTRWWRTLCGHHFSCWLHSREPWREKTGELTRQAVAAVPDHATPAFQARYTQGRQLYQWAFTSLLEQTAERLAIEPDVEAALIARITAKLAYARGYHGRIRLKGRTLDAWMEDSPEHLLTALKDSGFVDRQCPAHSRLLQAMQFGGAMFGVFSEQEQALWRSWLEKPEASMSQKPLPGTEDAAIQLTPGRAPKSSSPVFGEEMGGKTRSLHSHPNISANCQQAPSPPPPLPSTGEGSQAPTAPPLHSTRALYTALLQTETPLSVPPEADRIIHRILQRSGWLNRLTLRDSFPQNYAPDRLWRYIHDRHQRETRRYTPLTQAPGISRRFCRDALLQLAPAILVDGCWLIGLAHHPALLDTPRRLLLRIYADEIGKGETDQNHPNVYRRLLDSLGIDLPAFDTPEFAADPRLLDAAFTLPVYLLGMGWRAGQFFPELLGLNLAIELSGLGADYQRAIDILRYYGFDPTLFQLHLSIDNAASGHTALAAQAIIAFMEEEKRQLGHQAQALLWQRIRRGYRSLDSAALGLVAGLGSRYLEERLGRGVEGG